MIQLKLTSLPIDEVENEIAFVSVFEDERPLKGRAGLVDWRLNGKLSEIILKSRFSGQRGETLLMPTQGRLDSKEIILFGVGNKNGITDPEIPPLIASIIEKLNLKKCNSFSLSFSDFIPGMFEWRNAVRTFISMLSGSPNDKSVTLVEKPLYIEDAKKRHMDFAFDVKAHYDL